jgi:hypothetical protein
VGPSHVIIGVREVPIERHVIECHQFPHGGLPFAMDRLHRSAPRQEGPDRLTRRSWFQPHATNSSSWDYFFPPKMLIPIPIPELS